MEAEEFLRLAQDRSLTVFGTGYVAETFWYALDRHGLTGSVRCFLVSDGVRAPEIFHDRPVLPLSAAPTDGTLVCLAVHGALAETLLPVLRAAAPDAVWVYPFLTELVFGGALRREEIPTGAILTRQGKGYWLAVRYAALRDYLAAAPDYARTRDLYCRCMALHCGEATAQRRSDAMEALADSMARDGFDAAQPLRLTEERRVIDGLHRAACAALLGIGRVPAVIYAASDAFDALFTDRNQLPERFLRDNGFTESERAFLRKARRELEVLGARWA